MDQIEQNIEAPINQMPPAQQLVNVVDPDTLQVGSIPVDQLADAVSQGFKQATPEETDAFIRQEKYGSASQQALTGLEGAASAATFGVIPGFGSKEDIRGRREENPLAHMAGQAAGLVGSSLAIPGGGAAGLLEKAGAGAAKALVPAELGAVSKIGSMAVKGATENALFQAGDELSKVLTSENPSQAIEDALPNIGMAGLLGGGIGGAFGSVSPLWNATVGPKVNSILKAITDKAGGIDSKLPDAIQDAIHTSGIDIAPEVKAAMSSDPQLQDLWRSLQESQTASGIEAQQSLKNFRGNASKALVESLGRTSEQLDNLGELSAYESGKNIQDILHREIKTEYEPISEAYKKIETKFKNVEVAPESIAKISEDIAQVIQDKGYYLSESAPQAKLIRETLQEINNIKSLDDIKKYTSLINDKTTSPEMWKVGGDLRRIFRQAESDILSEAVGQKAPELLDQLSLGRTAYKDMMEVMDNLNDRLHVGKYYGPESFLKALKEMSPEDVVRRLSGKGDMDLVNLMSERFPSVAQAIKDYHIDSVLKSAMQKAPDGSVINPKTLFNAIDKLDPKFVEWAFPEASKMSLSSRFNSVKSLLEAIPERMNPSGTAKTLDSIWSGVPSSAMAMLSMIAGKNPIAGWLIGAIGKWMGRDIPDAVKLGLIKYLGSGAPIEAGGFKSMVEFIDQVAKGQHLINKASYSLFKSGQKVLPQAVIPNEKQREKLDKQLTMFRDDPQKMLDIGGKTGHYLPEHNEALGTYTANAVNYLNSKRPGTVQRAPLDKPSEPTKNEMHDYHRTLDIAQQPLMVLEYMKDGTLTSKDVQDFQALNPSLYGKLVQKLTDDMTDAMAKGSKIPHQMKLGLSLFMGQPLDSLSTPASIQAIQSTFSMGPTPKQQMGKIPQNALQKIPQLDMTNSQKAAAN